MPPTRDPARDLLFGLLALQNGLINQGQLVAAFQAWTFDKSRALADHLVGRGAAAPALPRGLGPEPPGATPRADRLPEADR